MERPNTQPATPVMQNSAPPTSQRRLHPLVATAAGAVIIASLVATAAMTGMFPKASSTGEPTSQTQAAQVLPQTGQPAVVDSAAPANPSAQQSSGQIAQQAAQQQPVPQPQRAPAPAPSQQQYAQQQQAQPDRKSVV